MSQFELNAELREEVGKGASRRLRRAGRIPAIIYGANEQPIPLVLDHEQVVRHLEHEAFYSSIMALKIGTQVAQVVLKDLQRHPSKRQILHMDLQRIQLDEKLTMRVPLHFLNEDSCPGVKEERGIVTHLMTDLEVECLPKHLPEYIDVDCAALHIGDTITLGVIKTPEGVEITALAHEEGRSKPVVSVQPPQAIEIEEEVAAEAEAVAAAVGEEPVEAEAAKEPEGKTEGKSEGKKE
ncbi:MAG: 50S ribosomal protein L25/general stress protein Ctc [Gammaproteobacteria bacterium]|nr:50S ribosomal protein L25/general stress protein Ctc [Gammaproteobacteria bacterium]MCI0590971.1 50S ribosomal protein L25/general stress protein Ctc [Gammaproteobacteria bacterium]